MEENNGGVLSSFLGEPRVRFDIYVDWQSAAILGLVLLVALSLSFFVYSQIR